MKPEHLPVIPYILKQWSTPGKELFVPSFMEKLKKSAEPVLIAAAKAEE